jgi:hypothetical protein
MKKILYISAIIFSTARSLNALYMSDQQRIYAWRLWYQNQQVHNNQPVKAKPVGQPSENQNQSQQNSQPQN